MGLSGCNDQLAAAGANVSRALRANLGREDAKERPRKQAGAATASMKRFKTRPSKEHDKAHPQSGAVTELCRTSD